LLTPPPTPTPTPWGSWSNAGAQIDGLPGDKISSVSFNGYDNNIAIGSITNSGTSDTGISNTGRVRVYGWTGTSWTPKGGYIYGKQSGEEFGSKVRINVDGLTLVASAPRNSNNRGAVRVYVYNSNWTQKGNDIIGEANDDMFGHSLAYDGGDIIVIGAIQNDGNGTNSGRVRVYKWNGSDWIQMGGDINGEFTNDQFGRSVSINNRGLTVQASDQVIAIGSPNNGNGRGHVRVYKWNGSNWIQMGGDIDGKDSADMLGHSVSLTHEGTKVAIGASSGKTRVYEYIDSNWVQKGRDITITGDTSSADYGHRVSIETMHDENGINIGEFVAVGASTNSGNGSKSGKVCVYRYYGTDWFKTGSDINGQPGDECGHDVSISNGGKIVGIASSNGGANNTGYVKVLKYTMPPTYYI
jgi:hypothetical protein